MNNKKQIPETPVTETVEVPIYKKRGALEFLSVLLAILILLNAALIVLMAVRAADGDDASAGTDAPTGALDGFTYTENLIKEYFAAFGADKVTGLTVAGKDYKIDEIDDEYVTEYINAEILNLATVSDGGKVNKTKPVDFADIVYLYILYVEKDGERIGIDHFNNAYSELVGVQVGAAKLGKDFDEKLMGLIPKDSGNVETDVMGTVSADDVIIITYEATVDGEKEPYESLALERWDLGETDAAVKEALLGACRAIGEEFTFDATHDIDGDGDEELVHYTATVGSVAYEENILKLTATLPEDYFGNSMEEEYTSLNGAELDFYIIVDHSVSYEVSYEKTVETEGKKETVKVYVEDFDDLTYDFITSKLGFKFETEPTGETEEAKDAAARAAYFAKIKEEQIASRDENVRANALALIWRELVENLAFDSLPEDIVDELVASELQNITSAYDSYYATYSDFAALYPTIESYARDTYGYTAEEYETYSDYIKEKYAPQSVKQMLLIYAIYNDLGLKNDTAKYTAERDEQYELFISDIIASAASQGTTLSRQEAIDYFNQYYGDNYLEDYIMSSMVEDYLFEKNTVDWELTEEK